MWEILKFLIKPSEATESLSQEDDKFKMITIAILWLMYALTSVWNIYFSMTWSNNTTYYVKLFFVSIALLLFMSLIIWGVWKIFEWKAKYLDVLLVTTLAEITIIIASIITITIPSLKQSIILIMWMNVFILIPAIIWYLVVWLKWLSKIEELSVIKVYFIIVLSLVIFVLSLFLIYITWIPLL
jgi:hypothetical protein